MPDAITCGGVVLQAQHDADIALVEPQPVREHVGGRRLQHGEFHVRAGEHGLRCGSARAVAVGDAPPRHRDACARRHTRHRAELLQQGADQQRGGRLAAAAGDRDDRHAAVFVCGEQAVDNRPAGPTARAHARVLMHADARRGVDLDDRAALRRQWQADVGTDEVDAGHIQTDLAGGPHASTHGAGVDLAGHVLCRAPGRQVGVAAQSHRLPGGGHRSGIQPLVPQLVVGRVVQPDPGEHVLVAFAAARVGVDGVHQLPNRGMPVADDLGRHASRSGHHALADHEHAVVVAFDVLLDDHLAPELQRAVERGLHSVRTSHSTHPRRHALAVVAAKRFQHHPSADAMRCGQCGFERGHRATLRHRQAGLAQQALGHFLVAGNADRDVAGLARQCGLDALLLRAPAELEHAGMRRQPQCRDAAPRRGVHDGARAGAQRCGLRELPQSGHASVHRRRLAGGQGGHDLQRQVERGLGHALARKRKHHAVVARQVRHPHHPPRPTVARGLAGQALQLQRQVLDDVGHVGARPQALDETPDMARRAAVYPQAGHGLEQPLDEAGNRRGGHVVQPFEVDHGQDHRPAGVDVGAVHGASRNQLHAGTPGASRCAATPY